MASNKNNVEMNKLFTKLVDSALTMTEMLDPKDQADVYIRLAKVVASTGIVTDLVKEKDIAVDDESSPIISSTGTKGSEDKSDKEETIIIDEKPAKTDAKKALAKKPEPVEEETKKSSAKKAKEEKKPENEDEWTDELMDKYAEDWEYIDSVMPFDSTNKDDREFCQEMLSEFFGGKKNASVDDITPRSIHAFYSFLKSVMEESEVEEENN